MKSVFTDSAPLHGPTAKTVRFQHELGQSSRPHEQGEGMESAQDDFVPYQKRFQPPETTAERQSTIRALSRHALLEGLILEGESPHHDVLPTSGRPRP